MNTKQIEDNKKKLKLSKRQREIIIGLMLGDGHMETQNNGRTYRLKVEQAIEHQDYVNWLHDNFKEWVLQKPAYKNKIDKRSGKKSVNIYFNTISHGALRFYAKQFYLHKRKIIPALISHWLTPMVLAVWFMDDGSIKSKFHKGKIINTQGFEKKEVQLLSKCLDEKFQIKSILRKQKNDTWQLYLLSESIEKFYKIIKPYILPSMEYKLINLG